MGANETLANSPALFGKLVDKATDAVMAGFGRGEELEADDKGLVVADKAGYDPKGLGAFLTTLADRNKERQQQAGTVRVASRDGRAAEEAGDGNRDQEARGHGRRWTRASSENVKYKPVDQAAIATVDQGRRRTRRDRRAAKDKPDDEASATTAKKKKKGFGLGKLMDRRRRRAEVRRGHRLGRRPRTCDTERDAKGGANPAMVAVKATAAELTAFKKEGKLS